MIIPFYLARASFLQSLYWERSLYVSMCSLNGRDGKRWFRLAQYDVTIGQRCVAQRRRFRTCQGLGAAGGHFLDHYA